MNQSFAAKRRVIARLARGGVWASAAALSVSVANVASPWLSGATAAGTNAGAAQVVTPASGTGGGVPLAAGQKATAFSLKLPTGAACTGDSANDGYRVQSYHVPSSVDPATLTFDSNGPIANSFDAATFRQPLYTTAGNPHVDAQTAPANPAPGPGPVTNIPAFSFTAYEPSTLLPAGTYNVGLACTKGTASPTQQDRFWNVQFTIAADLSWTAANPTTGTTTTTAVSGGTTTTTVAGATTTTTAPGATTTTTSLGATTTTLFGATTSTTASSAGVTTTTRGSGVGGVTTTSLPRSGRDYFPILAAGFLLAVFGRMARLSALPTSTKGSLND